MERERGDLGLQFSSQQLSQQTLASCRGKIIDGVQQVLKH